MSKTYCVGDIPLGTIVRATEIGKVGGMLYSFLPCQICKKPRWVRLNKGNPLYKKCIKCSGLRGQQSPKWKGGRRKNSDGYILIAISKDDFYSPTAENDKRRYFGYVLEHRLVMAKHLGRNLHLWEIVHHKNHIRDDNNIENLQLVTDDGHKQITLLENRIRHLENRVTLLEAENVLLKQGEYYVNDTIKFER